MPKRKILTYPDPFLRKQTCCVKDFDSELRELVEDMAETMYAAPGVGLAANQVGVGLSLVVIDISSGEEPKELIVLANPEILDPEGEQIDEEGCLSVIDCMSKVKRFQKIRVKAQDIEGNPLDFEARDFFARVIQHELDHLNGKLFIDRISSLKRALYKKKLKKILKEQQEESADE